MIDQDKMRALAKRLRDTQADCADSTEAADAIDLLLAEVEASAADKRDAERYRWLRELDSEFWEVNRMSNMARFYGETLDAEIDAALAQRQGEGS
ncbi:hypothetical protein KGP96_11635 [Burkholderia multivorans]|uniref:hypothetical protein n=1 Tax=Burkholderia multivorans TaxID=87883 RepID=UPI0020A01765|nr:hypothetical protein [Burkholderia multivorans]MCO8625972.1 hypothetical protein [Burkholderia multivorans]